MTQPWRAGHLPGIDPDAVRWHSLQFDGQGQGLTVQVPMLDEAQMLALAQRVRLSAQTRLQAMTVSQIIALLDVATARWLDADDPVRREAERLLPLVSGFDAGMVRLGLGEYLQAFRARALQRFVAEDFPNPKVLDEFQPAVKGGAVRAWGPALLVHHWAGNVPALPMWSFVCGLLVKAGNIGKLPSADPVFATLMVRLLCEVHPPWADCMALVWWKGGDPAPARTLFSQAETVLAYGGNAALREVRDQVPITTRYIGYGHKLGLALIGREALDAQRGPALVRLIAVDVMRWEQQGCYSPHVIHVESGGALTPREVAQLLAAELANLALRHPPRRPELEEAAAIAAWRQAAEWQALSDPDAALLGDAAGGWSVSFVPRAGPLQPGPGYRCITVQAVASLEEVPALLRPHASFLQSAALATTPERLQRLAPALGEAGITRLAAPGRLAQPEAGWHHDGRFNLSELVRMVEIEQACEQAADRLAAYAQEGAA